MKTLVPMLLLALALASCARPSGPTRPPSPATLRAASQVADQVRRCYRAPRVPSAGRGIVTRLLVRYGPDGVLVGLPLLVSQQGVTPEGQPYAGRMTEAARLAAIRCSPIRLPPELRNRRSSDFYLTFSPRRQA
jgi:hypothetical protein